MSKIYYDEQDSRGSYSSSSSQRRHHKTRSRSRSRSYSPPRSRDHKRSPHHRDRKEDIKHTKYVSSSDSSEGELLAPPPPIISKVSFGMKPLPPKTNLSSGIQMKLSTKANKAAEPKKITVASAFAADDSDDEVEEMPAECRMRMRNIGRDTPTSSGPNSFGKTKQGFCDSKKIFERNLKNHWEDDD